MSKKFLSKKSLLSFSMVLVLFLSFSLVLADEVQEESSLELKIIHTNDIHGRVEEGRFDGIGFTRIKTIVDRYRAENDNVLLLDAGDTVHGLPIANFSEGEIIIDIMNEIGYDYMVAGNHDFNFGYERLLELNEIADFPIFAGNVVYKENNEPIIEKEYDIIEMDGHYIAIFGLATPETLFKSHPLGTVGLDFIDPVEYSKDMVEYLHGQYDLDLVIALSHLGIDETTKYTERSTGVAKEVEGIDLIIDGHSHTVLEEGEWIEETNTLIVQAGEYGKNLGVVEVNIINGELSMNPYLITKEEALELEEDPELREFIDKASEERQEVLETVIGQSNVFFDGSRETVRVKESNLGNLLTDAMMHAYPEADLAITNGGGLRANIEVGDITIGDIEQVLPFGNQLIAIKVSGEDLVNALEHGAGQHPEPNGAFPQVSGVNYTINPNKEEGNRISDVMVNGEEIDLEKEYIVLTNDFLAAGGDGYDMFAEAETIQELYDLAEVLVEYIEFKEVLDYEVSDNRINTIEKEEVIEDEVIEEEVVEEEVIEEEVVEEEVIEEEVVEEYIIYIVVSGDTLSHIALNYNATWQEISEFNQMKNPHLIFPGDTIKIPLLP